MYFSLILSFGHTHCVYSLKVKIIFNQSLQVLSIVEILTNNYEIQLCNKVKVLIIRSTNKT